MNFRMRLKKDIRFDKVQAELLDMSRADGNRVIAIGDLDVIADVFLGLVDDDKAPITAFIELEMVASS